MGNQLFQSAREAVMNAIKGKQEPSSEQNENSMSIAKNAISSAYANSTDAEKVQLRELQEELFSTQTND
ncbi:DUF3813 domain-containing protein [Sutcliffiella rhizosphaerae]|uniref:DUF3813 domain-containing protein n=1 Tax=Sutcliffiella rhizosphaerae TaxID=2880967 RepID=A0ABN8ADV0_9BACI|nr:DUF3813 domain-containing protein [Sutcliffiella rhizosphaerae]CAG9623446.1 hypothetical protein BACCIP111883_04259 [Sutcliffiella rhizosphaerae]